MVYTQPGAGTPDVDWADGGRPQLIFFTELDASALLAALERPGTLALLGELDAGVALALTSLDERYARIARLLQAHGITTIAWLCLPLQEGFALNLTNYPRVLERYHDFHEWAQTYNVRLHSIGFSIEPPADSNDWSLWRAAHGFAHGLWLARDNALYPSAHNAYVALLARVRHDGYDVHAYQLPLIADDRRAGTTLVQRALDIVDLPVDVDVLLCDSAVPVAWLGDDMGGALIASYGPSADAIGVGALDISEPTEGALPWRSLRRDLLLAAQHTDTIYIASLEHCVRNNLLAPIAALNWNTAVRA
ncbi:MAG TPA: hypothetical protein VFT99_00455, partial [Roseiflexaceae bacterium]|nr:hypothetical protein [Roseiflexaceae bacterium]